MIITISVASGVAHTYMLTSNFVLIFCTMLFGYYTEVISPPEWLGENERPKQWAVRDGKYELLLVPALPAFLQRLAPHFLGYVPYITVWAQLFHSFFFNTSDSTQQPPAFVYAIVVGQFIAFSLFGVTQLWNQIREDGPHWYWRGEFSYLVLSVISKGLLGLTLVTQVFAFDSFSEAVAERQADMGLN